MKSIYLSGGMRSNWASQVTEKVKNFICFDPKDKQLEHDFRQYTAWDLFYVRQCDIFLCYIEKDNPSCLGLALELGYAKALNKLVVLVIEPENEKFKDKYFDILRASANVNFTNLNEAITFINNFKL